MAARRVNGDAGSELRIAVVEEDTARIVQTHDAANVFNLEGMCQPRVAHVFPGRISELALLEMKSRAGKAVEISDVVVMEMREDHIFDRVRIDVEQSQRLYRAAQERSLSPLRHFLPKAGVDDERSSLSLCQPHEIVHRHRAIVRVAADEVIAAARLAGGVADGEELIDRLGHDIYRALFVAAADPP
jgi:hypothetical protein